MSNIKFSDLGISELMLSTLKNKGFEAPSQIQSLVIPEFLAQQSNIIGQAQTGTGKTAAFSIPIIEKLETQKGKTKALVLTPTRELATQVADEIYSLTAHRKELRVCAVYGGKSIEQQMTTLRKGVDIVVGTPGRVIDLLERKALNLSDLDFFVLDEADEMLNMGFVEDIDNILSYSNPEQKMLFFSATMPKAILEIAKKYMKEYKILKVEHKEATTSLTEQIYFEVRENEKFDTLCRTLDFSHDFYGIIFARTKQETDDITSKLKIRGYAVDCLHGDINQAMRNKALASFKNKHINIMVATDVAARGIDVNNLTHVINYSIPNEAESYVHRIGRTGRAGKEGIAISFVTKREMFLLTRIQKMIKATIKKQNAPTINEVLNTQKESLIACVSEVAKENDYLDYLPLANRILQSVDTPETALAAILHYAYGEKFTIQNYISEQSGYKQPSNNSTSNESRSAVDDEEIRLFVALGRKDAYNPKKLLDMLHKECKTPARKVKDVKVLDNFSFITVPTDEAEIIMSKINKNNRKKPLITPAKQS